MESRLIEIARRKERLLARAEAQRNAIASSVEGLRGAFVVVDRGYAIARFVQTHPLLTGIGLAVVMSLRGRGLLSAVGRGLAVWRAWKSISSWAALFR